MINEHNKNFYQEIYEPAFSLRQKRSSSHWSVPWSDLMMTMFILFAVLYMYLSANSNLTFGEGPGKSQITDRGSGLLMDATSGNLIEKAFPEIYDLQLGQLKNVAEIELANDRAVRIILANDLLFDLGEIDLKPGARQALRDIADALRKTPYLVNISGHTDNVPVVGDKFPSNWELSALRACRVTRFLTEQAGIPARRFYVSGFSYFDPVATNYTEEGRTANRRVEIIITKDGQRNYYEY